MAERNLSFIAAIVGAKLGGKPHKSIPRPPPGPESKTTRRHAAAGSSESGEVYLALRAASMAAVTEASSGAVRGSKR
jgi:hypothetical protein